MNLNANCTRDVMLILEREVTPSYSIIIDNFNFYNYIHDCSEEYTPEEFIYHLGQCIQEGLIVAIPCNTQTSFGYQVRDLTPAGYKFLENTRDKTVSVAIAPACLSYFSSDKVKLSFHLISKENKSESFYQYPQKFTSYIIDFNFHIFSFEFNLTSKLEKFIIANFKNQNPYITLDEGFDDLTELNFISKLNFENYEIIPNGDKNIILNIKYCN